jgi:hypothetical protein
MHHLVIYGLSTRILSAVAHYTWGWHDPILPLLYGMKGKYLEVFGSGMLGALFYTHLIEQKKLMINLQKFIGRWSLVLASGAK